jgi:hypothetical protein
MIFDFYLYINFVANRQTDAKKSFKQSTDYAELSFNESVIDLKNCYAVSAFRSEFSDHYYENETLCLWIFGYVFTSNKFNRISGNDPKRLKANQVFDIINTYEDSFYDYLKGNFNIIIHDKVLNVLKVVTDKLNVLPLYYAQNNNRLVISSNTKMILENDWVDRSFDSMALGMQILFDYLLGEHYFVKGIKRLENGSDYKFSNHGLKKYKYWDVSHLYHHELMPKWPSLDKLIEQLKANVDLYSSQSEKILVSLTGGFDGRTNLALLRKPVENFMCYSYGKKGSKQITVPLDIASRTGINYEPIYLGVEFLSSYLQNTHTASIFSNGTAPAGFCNIPYSFNNLRHYSDSILTGLFGSELLRPLHNNGIQVNDKSFEIFLNIDLSLGIRNAIKLSLLPLIFNADELNQFEIEIKEYFETEYFNKYSSYDRITRFFFFIIQEGIRKYFTQEISIERVFVNTYFPYFDYDIVELIYETPWAGIYNGFLGESKFKRRKGQLLYAYTIKKYFPELGKIKLDRGYTPSDLLMPFPFNYLKISLGVFKAKKYMKSHQGNDTFKTQIWSKDTINSIVNNPTSLDIRIVRFLKDTSTETLSKNDFLTYRHLVTLSDFF